MKIICGKAFSIINNYFMINSIFPWGIKQCRNYLFILFFKKNLFLELKSVELIRSGRSESVRNYRKIFSFNCSCMKQTSTKVNRFYELTLFK